MLILILWCVIGYLCLAQLYGDAFRFWSKESLEDNKTLRRWRGVISFIPAVILGPLSYFVLYLVAVKFDDNPEYFWSVVKGKPKYSLSW